MNRIKKLRKEKGLTLRQLSKEIDIPVSTLSRYEQTGEKARNPKLNNLLKLAEFFGVSIEYIQGKSEEKATFWDSEFWKKSIKHVNDSITNDFLEICKALNAEPPYKHSQIEKNKKLISFINNPNSMSSFTAGMRTFFELSLYAYNGDKKALKVLVNVLKTINSDYLSGKPNSLNAEINKK